MASFSPGRTCKLKKTTLDPSNFILYFKSFYTVRKIQNIKKYYEESAKNNQFSFLYLVLSINGHNSKYLQGLYCCN